MTKDQYFEYVATIGSDHRLRRAVCHYMAVECLPELVCGIYTFKPRMATRISAKAYFTGKDIYFSLCDKRLEALGI